ncbi:MAG: glycosyltransferase family 2 protein [Planctomycetaceae bacterium]
MCSDLVSVVIPAYNLAHYVREAIDSALAQTNCRVEVIVVNDGSTDHTREVLGSYGERIKAVHQINQGLSAARNTGIAHATGEWVSFLDADDYWHREKTERQLAAVADHPDVGAIGTNGGGVMPEHLPTDAPVHALSVRDFLCRTPISASSTMVRRRHFDAVGGFDTALRSAEDRDMWLRLAACVPVWQIELPSWFYRLHPGQMSHNPERMYENYRRVLDKFFAEHPSHASLSPLAYSFLYQDAALCYANAGRMPEARRFLVRSILTHPSGLDNQSWRRAKLLVNYCGGRRFASLLKRLTNGSGSQPLTGDATFGSGSPSPN